MEGGRVGRWMDSHMSKQACKYLIKPVNLLLQSNHASLHTPAHSAYTFMAITTFPRSTSMHTWLRNSVLRRNDRSKGFEPVIS